MSGLSGQLEISSDKQYKDETITLPFLASTLIGRFMQKSQHPDRADTEVGEIKLC